MCLLHVPIPGKWTSFKVHYYHLRSTIALKFAHQAIIALLLLAFVVLFVDFRSTFIWETEIRYKKQPDSSEWYCTSLGYRDASPLDFADSPHRNHSYARPPYPYTFMNYDMFSSFNEVGPQYMFLSGFLDQNLWTMGSTLDPIYGWGASGVETATPTIFTNGTMDYTVEHGHAQTVSECQSLFESVWCHKANFRNIMFWYNSTVSIDLGPFREYIESHTNQSTSFWNLRFIATETGRYSPYAQGQYYYDYRIDLNTYRTAEFAHFLTNSNYFTSENLISKNFFTFGTQWFATNASGSVSDRDFFCDAVFNDTKFSVYLVLNQHSTPLAEINRTHIDMDDLNVSFWKINVHLTDCGYSEVQVLLTLPTNSFYYTDGLTRVSNADQVMNRSYIWIKNISSDMTDEEVLDHVWGDEICGDLVAMYCDYVDVSPYSCKRKVHKSLLESLSLSASFTNSLYSVVVIGCGILFRCLSKQQQDGTGTVPFGSSQYFRAQN